jgi:hypothetical protein
MFYQMKIAVIVLSVLVVFTDQQFYHHQPSTAAERLFWLSRYYSPRPAFDYYNRQPVNYADDNQADDDDSFHPFMPPSPSAFSQVKFKFENICNFVSISINEFLEGQALFECCGKSK